MDANRPDIPYRNLVLTGYMGAGKRSAGRAVAVRLGAALIDVEAEIQTQEGQSLASIRATYGEARARSLAQAAIRALDLRRHSIIVVSGTLLLQTANRRVESSGEMLCLTCALDEILRRMHAAMGARFHQRAERAVLIARLKRTLPVCELGYPRLDTTYLSVDQVADRAIAYWRRGVEGLKPPPAVEELMP
ncbi:MAG: hypothetical protein JXB47_06275 [Anaerolineae bacterium]|nr:hypothetical protein [Anaerolineae bacterium]